MHKDSYLQATNLQLDLWGDQFRTLRRRVAHLGPVRRRALARRLDALEARKRTIKRRLRLAAADESAHWRRLRGELAEAMDEFRARAKKVHDNVQGVTS